MPWISDAQMAGSLSEAETHKTAEISRFLDRHNHRNFIIVASKGMGKTTLIRLKRQQLNKHEPGIVLIPSHNTEIDNVSLPSSPDSSMIAALSNAKYWRELWECSIMLSILLSCPLDEDNVRRNRARSFTDRTDLPTTIIEDLKSQFEGGTPVRRRPSEILGHLLRHPKGLFEEFRRDGLNTLHGLFRELVTSAVAVFIDSLDQELELKFDKNLDVWRAGQVGLLRAAWELSRANMHAKIYVSVRQEAWASFDDPVKANMRGSVLIIEYRQADLRHIFQLMIQKNDGNHSIAEFFGFDTIYNRNLEQEEDVFEFVCRHTLGVPRWLAELGTSIGAIRTARTIITRDDERRRHELAVAETVHAKSSDLAQQYLGSEMSLFFKRSAPEEEIRCLLKPVQSTVLTLANINRLASRYAKCSASPLEHPFCLLMNIGLIGSAQDSRISADRTIRFKMPYEFDWKYQDVLPKDPSTLYFLHPSLHQFAQNTSAHFTYAHIRIGNGLLLEEHVLQDLNRRRWSVFASYSSQDAAVVYPLIEGLEDTFNEAAHNVDIWIDRTKMRAARSYLQQMTDGNQSCDFLVFFASRQSIRSQPVLDELALRRDRDFGAKSRTLFTVIIDDLEPRELPMGLSADHVLRIGSPMDIQKLARDLELARSECVSSAS